MDISSCGQEWNEDADPRIWAAADSHDDDDVDSVKGVSWYK